MVTLRLLWTMVVFLPAAGDAEVVQIQPEARFAGGGTATLRWEKAGAAGGGFLESPPIAVQPSQVYLLDCKIKGRELLQAGPALLSVRFTSAAGRRVTRGERCDVGAGVSSGPGPGGRFPAGTFDWQPYRLYLRTADGAERATIRFCAPPSGAAWIDDVRLCRVPAVKHVKYEIRDAVPIPGYGDAAEGYLTDGIFCWNQGGDNRNLGRGYRGLEQGIGIRLSLPRRVAVDRLVCAFVRPNTGHTLKSIAVHCDKYGRSVTAAQGPGYLTEQFDQRLWIVEVPVRQTTDAVELRLFGRGYLVPYEILVVEGDQPKGADMQNYLLAGWVVLAAAAAPVGEAPVVVENDLLRMEFCPVEGGVCKRMLYKPSGKELVYAYSDAGYGLFRDRFWSPTSRDFADVVYQHELTTSPGGASIHLWGRGTGGVYAFTEVHKTITLRRASPLIRAEYEIKNTVDSMTDADYGFWVHNFLGVLGGTNRYFIPTTQGVLEVENDPAHKPREPELWIRDPARGWMGCVGQGNCGLAWSVDYRYLNLFYQFLGLPVPCCEWQYNRLQVPCGQSLKTAVTLMPFTGLARLDGFFDGVAGEIRLPSNAAPGSRVLPNVGLVGADDRQLTLRFRSRLLPATAWTARGAQGVTLRAGAVQRVAWPQEMVIPAGTTVLGCEILDSGRTIGSMERVLSAGRASGIYRLEPECPAVGSKQPLHAAGPTVPEPKLSLDVATPHVPWARPYARGRVKALILTDCSHQREIVELLQRFDLQVETEKLFFDASGAYFTETGERSLQTPQQAQARLNKKLGQPWDVIMVAGLHWTKTFGEDAQKAILQKLAAGTGLVCVGPLGVGGPLRSVLPFATGERRSGFGFLEPKARHFLTCGVPYDLLPRIAGLAYDAQPPQEQVLLSHKPGRKEIPLLSAGQFGQGRWVCCAWDVYSNLLTAEGYSFSRITPKAFDEFDPHTRTPGQMSDRAGRAITWRCWEYFFSLAGRSLLWAAHREPDLAAEIGPRDERGDLAVSVDCAGARRTVVLEMTYRNKFSEEMDVQRQDVELARGTSVFRFAPPSDLPPGVTLADLRVLTPGGRVITWASSYYQTTPRVEIAAVDLEKTILAPGSEPTARGRVKLSAAAAPGDQVEVLAWDLHDRLVAQRTFAATGAGTAVEISLSAALSKPVTLEVRLQRGRQTLDKRTQTVLVLQPRTWDPRECCQYEWYSAPIQGWMLPYLYDVGRRRAALMGATSMMDNPLFARLDLEAGAFTSPLGIWDISDHQFHEKSNAYARSKDRQLLVRQPSLWDPAFRAKAGDAMRRAAKMAMTYGGGYAYCLGDEMSLTSYNAYYDFDFAPASVAGYRGWLAKRYGTVEALNRQWETAHRDWATIEPMTAAEARARENGNYSPWADFRTFMDDSLADFFACLQKCLEEEDPQAKISISGTQDATAGNGMDWWKLCQSLKVLHGYASENTQYMHQAFSRSTGTLCVPYLNNACGRASGPVVESRLWWGALYECFGQTSLGMSNCFLPDLTFSETGAAARAYLTEARGGLWPLLRSVRRDPAPVAILYSHPSVQASFILNREQRCQKVRDAWVTLLHDSGLQFDFVAYAQLQTPGWLRKCGYRALILPETLALSDKEVEQIGDFVRSGGLLIADNSAGWMDEHCRTLKAGRLDDLFGLTVDRRPAATDKPRLTLKEDWGILKAGQPIVGPSPIGKVAPAGATATVASDDPGAGLLYRSRRGLGEAVYLNFSLVPYREERLMGGRGELLYRQLIGGALALAGIRPEFVVEPAGKRQFHGHVVSFTDRDVRYLGVIREFAAGEAEEAYSIRFPVPGHVYDVRARKHLGTTDKISAVLYAGAAKIYCLSPLERPAPTLTCPTKAARGASVRCRLGIGTPSGSTTVVRLEVCDPAGKLRPYYSGPHVLLPDQTQADVSFRLALNDPPGTWLLRAVEISGGRSTEHRLTVDE